MSTQLAKRVPRLEKVLKEFEVQFKWFLTWIVFFLLQRGWKQHGQTLDTAQVKSVLFLRYDRIGDMVVSLPTFHALKRRFPHLKIDVLASPSNQMILAHDDTIREVLVYDKSSIRRTMQTMRILRRKNYDVTIDLLANVSATSLFILLLAGKDGYKVGVRKNNSVGLYDFIIPESQMRTVPAVKLHFSALIPFGLDAVPADDALGLQLSEESLRRGEQAIEALRLPDHSGLIGINISAGKPNRYWGLEKYQAFVEALSEKYSEQQFIIFAAPTDFADARKIAASGGKNVAMIPEGLSLMDVAAMIKHLDLIMTPDTSICHIASSLRVPLLGLFTAAEENFARWQPWHFPSWVLRPASGDNLEGISVEAYLSKADEVIAAVHSRTGVR